MRVEGTLLSPRPGQDKEDSREGERGEEGEGKGVQAKGKQRRGWGRVHPSSWTN